MSDLKTVYDAEIEVLSPLHIGTGRALQRGYDYTVFGNQTWRINENVLFQEVQLRAAQDRAALNRLLMARPAEELLEANDYEDHPEFFRYHLPGQPRAEGRGAELRECLKDSRDRPYIPGSSFKGALRTILAWSIFRAERMSFKTLDLGRNRSWAGQPVEREIFGRNPNYDLLRALHVSDSQPVASDTLMLANVQVVVGNRAQAPIEVEAFKPGTRLRLRLTLDEHLLAKDVVRRLGWHNKGTHLRNLAIHGRNFANRQIKRESAHFAEKPELRRLAEFYQLLARLRIQLKGTSHFPVQMSWGGGWASKTLGDQIPQRELEEVIDRYRLSRSRNRAAGDPFPRSRRLYFYQDSPAMPMGWVLVRLEKQNEGEDAP